MSFYQMKFEDVLSIPISRFWFLSDNMERIEAEKNISLLTTIACSRHSESMESRMDNLKQSLGQVVIRKPFRDSRAIQELKNMIL